MQGVVWSEEQVNEIVGDGLYGMFEDWCKRQWPYGNQPEQVVRAFALWMVSTPEGNDALERIKDFPRQLSLKFPDDVRPWHKVESEGKTVYIAGTVISLQCPTCRP